MTSLFDDLPGFAPVAESSPKRSGIDTRALLAGLNDHQRAAVLHEGSPLLIVAGAGSGKTRVLTHRIAHLLAARGAQPGQILAITFTNKAAGEMKERVAALVGPRAKAMWVSTFHSACVRVLRAEHKRLAVSSSFSIYDQADSQRLMTMVCRDLDLDPKRYPPRSFSIQVSNLKNELVDWETFRGRAANHTEEMLAEAYQLYLKGRYFWNNRDQAFHVLEQAFEERSTYMPSLMADPLYDPLRDDPRFDDLLRRVGAGWAWHLLRRIPDRPPSPAGSRRPPDRTREPGGNAKENHSHRAAGGPTGPFPPESWRNPALASSRRQSGAAY